jgi:hypothetical protein
VLAAGLWVPVAGVATGLWLAVFAVLAAATNPRRVAPGPQTLDLPGSEPPAIVNLLARDWRLGREAVPATLVDLAARRHLAIDQVGEQTLVRVSSQGTSTATGVGR